MAIRDVVTRGYGNGTYSPGVNKLPVRGYAVSTITPSAAGFTLPPERAEFTLPDRRPEFTLPDESK